MWLAPSPSSSQRKQSIGRRKGAATFGQHGAAVGAKPPGPLKRLTTASKLPNLPKDHFTIVVRPGGGLDVRHCSQHKVFNALTMAARLTPSATVCWNSMQTIFVATPGSSRAPDTSKPTWVDMVTGKVHRRSRCDFMSDLDTVSVMGS
ncbi:hypothetical protein HPB49_004210 [Dermacentor silvarum]|uniref:Uncharacterized protein n=1 Tax=Dermacentor silvarum TaxID=543639 RepID=A0ACB8CVA5_DERSI|nr:hypothetical protein HPB49_004210 [Dermacentor silvarum]